MKNTVFLNAAKVNFDKNLDFSDLASITNLFQHEQCTSDEQLLEYSKDCNILISKELPITKEIIDKLPESVELICEAGTGYNNIDIQSARARNITVCNLPGYSSEAVAQLALTFILNFASSMITQQKMISQKDFSNFTKYLQVPHFELRNKTLGVIGAGSIGWQLIKLARAFDMKVLVHSRTEKNWADENTKFVSLDFLLKNSDFVSLHCPLNSDTKHMISKHTLKLMKKSSFIINTARGSLINEADLIDALKNKVIAGAGLDVLEQEPPSLENPLLFMDNVILTPHIGWKCIESRNRLIKLLYDNINGFIAEKPINVVN
ncbi:NAD(P)-dependent oxidoreductase [Clostridium oryzae]|uniref:Putative 2-hydroxyacid dehydrogenase n=1 Tax=Clostridium oryzae TaxID=1450648 RepID=A0A1V4IIY4_9CLOT|nr:NAD(P)-dependent oxidoreductase [Clostridium oryzae]OPJ59794.1 putative 2-hydroxyacid dehydrogenase [Clostridium oryzae]